MGLRDILRRLDKLAANPPPGPGPTYEQVVEAVKAQRAGDRTALDKLPPGGTMEDRLRMILDAIERTPRDGPTDYAPSLTRLARMQASAGHVARTTTEGE